MQPGALGRSSELPERGNIIYVERGCFGFEPTGRQTELLKEILQVYQEKKEEDKDPGE